MEAKVTAQMPATALPKNMNLTLGAMAQKSKPISNQHTEVMLLSSCVDENACKGN
jgi:hypothetical protein